MNALRAAERSATCGLQTAGPSIGGEAFDLMVTAPQGVVKLRELILSLAVRGKLVAQDSADVPAAKLLDRISKERTDQQGTRRTGRRRGSANAQPAPPFSVPSSWVWVNLRDITHEHGQQTPVAPFTYIDVSSIDNVRGRIKGDLPVVAAANAPSRARKLIEPGTVLYSTVRPYLKNIAIVDESYDPVPIASTAFAILSPNDGLLSKYLYHYLRSSEFTSFVASRMIGVAYPAISDASFFEGSLPLPPLAEQRRIVARVEELMGLCDELEALGRLQDEQHAQVVSTLFDALVASTSPEELTANWQRIASNFDLLLDRPEAVDALEQTILQLAVRGLLAPQDPGDEPADHLLARIAQEEERSATKARKKCRTPKSSLEERGPFELPVGWAWAHFADLGEFGRGKSKHRPRNDPRLFSPGIYPLIQTGEVSRADEFIEEIHSYYSEEGLAQSKLWPKGTLCITIAANIADSAILGFEACFPDSVVGFIPSPLIDDTRYFHTFMLTARQRLIDFAPATAQKNINLEVLNNLLIPIPPAAEMHRIVSRIEELRGLCADLRKSLQQARTTQSHVANALGAQAIA